jgi:hypothetical protein
MTGPARRRPVQPFSFAHQDLQGDIWKANTSSQRFRRLRQRVGLDTPDANGEKLVPYSLRQFRLTEAATQDGLRFVEVKLMAGHETNEMTKRYVKEVPEHLVQAAMEGRARRLGQKP